VKPGKGGARWGLTAREHGRADYANRTDREAKQELSSIVANPLRLAVASFVRSDPWAIRARQFRAPALSSIQRLASAAACAVAGVFVAAEQALGEGNPPAEAHAAADAGPDYFFNSGCT
jgi:hypothetical protein